MENYTDPTNQNNPDDNSPNGCPQNPQPQQNPYWQNPQQNLYTPTPQAQQVPYGQTPQAQQVPYGQAPQAPYRQQPQNAQPVYAPRQSANPAQQIPPEYRPLSPWAYFGYTLLFAIPIVGFVFLIVFSCSRANLNRRNFARSYWCMLLLAAIIFSILLLLGLLNSDLLDEITYAFR